MTTTDRAAVADALTQIGNECREISRYDGSRTCRDLASHVSALATICRSLLQETAVLHDPAALQAHANAVFGEEQAAALAQEA